MSTNDGLVYSTELGIGGNELYWLQGELMGPNSDAARRARLAGLVQTGLVLPRTYGTFLSRAWKIEDTDDDGSITCALGVSVAEGLNGQPHIPGATTGVAMAIDDSGYVICLENSESDGFLPIPNDDTWYTVVVSRATDQYERGTITVTTGSAVITGTKTEFLKFRGKTTHNLGNRGTYIRIDAGDSSSGNEGVYEIDTITSNTSATLTAIIGGTNESGIAFTVKGKWFSVEPADLDIHMFSKPEFSLVTRTRAPGAGQIILADVKRNDASGTVKCEIIDRRYQWAKAVASEPMAAALTPRFTLDPSSPFTAVELDRGTVGTSTGGDIHATICNAGATHLYAAVCDFGQIEHRICVLANGGTWSTLGAIEALASSQPTIVELPRTSAYSLGADSSAIPFHRVFYIMGGKCYERSWMGSVWTASTLVWDPNSGTPGHSIADPYAFLARNGRLFVIGRYFNGADYRLRYIYSDDYGATWSSSTAGTPVGINAIAYRPRIGQAPNGTLFVTYDDTQATAKVYMYDSDSESSLVIASGLTPKEISMSGIDCRGPAPIWFSSTGQPMVAYSILQNAGVRSSCIATLVNYDRNYGSSLPDNGVARMFTIDAATGINLQLDWCVGRDGIVNLIALDSIPINKNFVHVRLIPSEFRAPKVTGLLY